MTESLFQFKVEKQSCLDCIEHCLFFLSTFDVLHMVNTNNVCRVWRMPLWQHYTNQMKKSPLADLNNISLTPGRWFIQKKNVNVGTGVYISLFAPFWNKAFSKIFVRISLNFFWWFILKIYAPVVIEKHYASTVCSYVGKV